MGTTSDHGNREDEPRARLSANLPLVLGALYDLNRHRDPATLGRTIVSVVARVIACDSAMLARIDPAAQSFTLACWPDDRFASVDHNDAWQLHRRDHPLVGHYAVRRDARAWSLHDFVTPLQFRNTLLYKKLYQPHGIEFQLVLTVPWPDRAPRVLALNRRHTAFSDDDRHLLELLWPHLAQAVRNSRSTRRPHHLTEHDEGQAARGVIVLDNAGRVELCTEQARIWLTRYCIDGFSRREIRSLPEPISSWVSSGLDHHTLLSRGIADPPATLFVRRGDQFLALRLVMDHGRGQHLVLMEETPMTTPPDLLVGLGLTPREAEVLAWVAQGKTNREVGLILGLSTRTVQKHLERVFAKLGVESRTGAILRAWQVGRFEAWGARAVALPPEAPLPAIRPSNPR